MRKLFTILFVLLVCMVAVGFYRGWFTVSNRSTDAGSHKVNLSLTVDADKVKEDAETVKEKATELTSKATEGAKNLGDRTNGSE